MISKRSWWLLVTVLGGGASVLLAAVFGYLPTAEDLRDPLGRPATLTDSIVASSAGLDQVTTVLEPKQAELTRRISVLSAVAGSLDDVVDQAGELTPLAGDANREIGHVIDVAHPLPALITRITGRAGQATDAAHDLEGSITSLDTRLAKVGDRLVTLHASLDPLRPRADALAEVLARIERESQRIAPISPLLPLIPRAPR